MSVLDPGTGTARTQPDQPHHPLMGDPLVIILERDGSLHHYPLGRPPALQSHAQGPRHAEQVQPGVIARLFELTFGRLTLTNGEMRVHDQSKG